LHTFKACVFVFRFRLPFCLVFHAAAKTCKQTHLTDFHEKKMWLLGNALTVVENAKLSSCSFNFFYVFFGFFFGCKQLFRAATKQNGALPVAKFTCHSTESFVPALTSVTAT